MKTGVIYNVLVKGFSVGMTFSRKQAEEWQRGATHIRDAVIVPVRYRDRDPNPQSE